MADYDYDEGEVTPRERLAAQRQKGISQQNALNVRTQLQRQLANYDTADQQNRKLADLQLQQNSRKTSADRFEAQRDLQNAATGLLGTMGTAMNGSSTGNLMRMLEDRNDKENSTYWAQHQQNQDSVENSYQDSLNQNRIARLDAMQSAEKAINDIATDMSASLNNINPNLAEPPGTPTDWMEGIWDPARVQEMQEQDKLISGYMRPDQEGARSTNPTQRNRLGGNDYFSRLMNRFNGTGNYLTPTRLQHEAGLFVPTDEDQLGNNITSVPDSNVNHQKVNEPTANKPSVAPRQQGNSRYEGVAFNGSGGTKNYYDASSGTSYFERVNSLPTNVQRQQQTRNTSGTLVEGSPGTGTRTGATTTRPGNVSASEVLRLARQYASNPGALGNAYRALFDERGIRY